MINTIIHGDCLEIMKNIPDGSIDAIITDPPYGTTACKWDQVIPFEEMWKELKRIIKPNGAILLFGSEPFSSALRMSNIKMYKYDWIWDKNTPTGFQTAKYKPMKREENIIIFGNGKVNYYPQMITRDKQICGFVKTKSESNPLHQSDGKMRRYDIKYPQSILSFYKVSGHHILHPTQKPVALLEYLIKTYTNEGEIVLDFTSGSGTTGIAAQNTNRNYILIEKDEGYYNISKERLSKNKILLGLV